MAKITVEHQDEIRTFPVDSILELKIEECNVRTVQGRNGDWEKVEFKFKVLGIQAIGDGGPTGPYENWITQYIYGSVPFRLTNSPENRLRIWAEAIFRQELGVGFELDTDMFVGRQVRGITSQYEAKARDAQGNPLKRHQIETLLPFGGNIAPAPQGQPQAAQPQGQVANGPTDPWATTTQQPAAQPVGAQSDPWGTPGVSPEDPPF